MIPISGEHPAFSGLVAIRRRDITPPLGIYAKNWGASQTPTADRVHQPLTLTALIIKEVESDAHPFVLVSLDLGWWKSKAEHEAFARVASELGLDPARFLVSLTHTHSGPSFCPYEAEQRGGPLIPEYLQLLCGLTKDVIQEAINSAEPALIEVASGHCDLATNRDLPDPFKSRFLVGWNPGEIADDELIVARVSTPHGKILGTVVNYACHPTILAWENEAISPDYVGTLRDVVESDTGAPCIFVQGASGELAPALQYVGNTIHAERAGRCAGHASLAILYGMLPPAHGLVFKGAMESGAPLALWKPQIRNDISKSIASSICFIDLAIKSDFPTVEEIRQKLAETDSRAVRERLNRKLLIRQSIGNSNTYRAGHLIWRIGNIFFVGVPNEAYSILQQTLRAEAAPFPLFVITLANGSLGYLPPAPLYDEDIYSVGQTPFAAGCLETTISSISQNVRRLKSACK